MNRFWLSFLALVFLGGIASAQSLTLSPAVVPLGGKRGQSTTQHLTLLNSSSQRLAFDLVAKDVVVKGGQRQFVDAGDTPGSIAATAVFSKKSVVLEPNSDVTVDVTLTLPTAMQHRAVIILFQGTTKLKENATVSLGTLITFELAAEKTLSLGSLTVAPATASRNASAALSIDNPGTEPIVVRGAYAIVAASGAFVGKVALKPHRLLPGEHGVLDAPYPGELASGRYRVIATIESGWKSWTRSAELVVP